MLLVPSRWGLEGKPFRHVRAGQLLTSGPLFRRFPVWGHSIGLTPPPPPLVQATVNDQKLTEATPSVAWIRVLLTRRNLHDTRVDMMYYSEDQEPYLKTLLVNRATLTQNMNFVLLKTKVSGSTQGTQ